MKASAIVDSLLENDDVDPKDFTNYHFGLEQVLPRIIVELCPDAEILSVRDTTGMSHVLSYEVDMRSAVNGAWRGIPRLNRQLETEVAKYFGWTFQPYLHGRPTYAEYPGHPPLTVSYALNPDGTITLDFSFKILRLDTESNGFRIDPKWSEPF